MAEEKKRKTSPAEFVNQVRSETSKVVWPTREETAAALELSEDTLKVVIHRLRKRFRSLIRAEILQTVDEPGEVAAELDYLVRALGQQGE